MKKAFRISLSLLIVAFLLTAVACAATGTDTGTQTGSPATEQTDAANTAAGKQISITVDVVHSDGTTATFPLTTSATDLGAALLEAKIVSGDMGQYGLYIKAADGETADYDTDGAWWGLFQNGTALMSGADTTPIADGDHFELVYSK